ncbi:Alpha/Beta hydrolase protein [Pestalotiopsis sp. NC0098]|nr:Alpha/Beta hydrolase protein [Pestalotiopsis sp. NC0098]
MADQHKSRNYHLGNPAPEWTEFYNRKPDRVPQLVGTPQEMRDVMKFLKAKATGMVPPMEDGLVVQNLSYAASDGAEIPLRLYKPSGRSKAGPAIVYIHGGGWTLGDLEGEDLSCRSMCLHADCVVVSMDYRLAPEHQFPTGLEDVWDALMWTIENSSRILVDANCLVLGGSSSGGNMAAVLAHRARDRGISLKGQILRIPSVCHIDAYPPSLNLKSMEELEDAPLLSKRSMELFWSYYNPSNKADPDASPLLRDNFVGLAPAYVQIAGMDPLRDEGLAYVEKLRQANVDVHLDIYPGFPHAFGYSPELPSAKTLEHDLLKAIREMIAR